MFGDAARMWFAARYQDHLAKRNRFQTPAGFLPGRDDTNDLGLVVARAVVSAANAFGYVDLRGVRSEITSVIRQIIAIAARSDGKASGAAFQLALSDDLQDLDGASASAVAAISLWPGSSPPPWIIQRWDRLKSGLIEVGVGWEAWVSWYQDRLSGTVRDEREPFYIEVPDAFWADGPVRVNTWILKQIEKLESGQEPKSAPVIPKVDEPTADRTAPPSIPAQQPAAIEPVWKNGRLTLPKGPTKSDLTGRKFGSALKSLREEMRVFASDISGDANIDRRFASYVQQLAEQIPTKAPKQAELFRLGHVEAVFSGYAETVNEEWPTILASRYHALSLHFDRTLRQSPLWREFKRNAAKGELTAVQVRAALSLATEVKDLLRVEEAEDLVDQAIPQTLEQVAQPLTIINEPSEDLIEARKELLAYDLLESVNNILKALFQAAIWVRISATAKEAGGAFTTEARKSIIKEAGRLGKRVGPALSKWTRRLALGTIGYQIAGKSLIVWLVANFPATFKWIEQAAHFLASQ